MFRTGLVLILVTGGFVAGGTSRAVAMPTLRVTVTVTSAYDSTDAKVAIASCPATHPVLYGSMGQITDGAGEVVLTDVVPDLLTGAAIVTARENGTYSGDWSLTAYAVCGAGAGSPQRVSATTAHDSTTTKTATAACPLGTQLFGLGYSLEGDVGVQPSQLEPGGRLSTVSARATAGPRYTGAWSLTVYGVCGAAGAVTALTTASGWTGNSSHSEVAPPCPAGSSVSGVGATVTPDGGYEGYIGLTRVSIGQAGRGVGTGQGFWPWWPYLRWGLETFALCTS